MRSRGLRRRLVALVAVLMVSSGCGSDPGSEDEAAGDPPASATPSQSSAPSTEPTETPAEEPSVAPATGPELVVSLFEEEEFRFRLPEGPRWEVSSDGESASLFTPTSEWFVSSGIVSAATGKGPDFYARGALREFRVIDAEVRRQDDLTIDGVEGYVLEGVTSSGGFVWDFGAARGDSALSLTFEAPRDTPKARAWLESVIASAEWL